MAVFNPKELPGKSSRRKSSQGKQSSVGDDADQDGSEQTFSDSDNDESVIGEQVLQLDDRIELDTAIESVRNYQFTETGSR